MKSLALVVLGGLRLAGPMTYYPAHISADGRKVNARCEGNFFLNDFYIDGQGNRVDTSQTVRLVFWNSNSATPGKGLADTAAKFISVGKEISCHAQINVYQGKVYDANDQVVGYADGSPLLTKRISFVVEPRTLRLGDDSEKLLQQEFANFANNGGVMSFDSRPADWRTPGTVGANQWAGISGWRSSQVFTPGAQAYGYAKVGTINGQAVTAHNAAPANAGVTAAPAAAAPVAGTAVVAGGAVVAAGGENATPVPGAVVAGQGGPVPAGY